MKSGDQRCLYCGYHIEGVQEAAQDFHPKCSKKFFGTASAPELPYNLVEMERLAMEVVRSQATIPGVQAKISLNLEKAPTGGKARRLTLVGLWGQFVLKPPTADYPFLPEIEDTTMRLAEVSGIDTVPHSLIRMQSGELAYITRRIDRSAKSKIAMEDMCQITGRLTEDKYKGSMEQVGKAIRRYSVQPGLDSIRFFELSVFCFLTGNADMHLKKFSLYRPSPGSIKLTPAYDLVATKLLLPQDVEECALALNGKKSNLLRKDFDALAVNLEIPLKAKENSYHRLANSIGKWDAILEAAYLSNYLREAYGELVAERWSRIRL